MSKRKNRITINDLDTKAMQELNEDDVRKITGGTSTFGANPSDPQSLTGILGTSSPLLSPMQPKRLGRG